MDMSQRAVEYRLSPEALYPAAVNDVKAAVRWMRAHATEYRIDTTRIAVSGCSAGGQIAALVGTTNGEKHFEGIGSNADRSSLVQAIIDMDGILISPTLRKEGRIQFPGNSLRAHPGSERHIRRSRRSGLKPPRSSTSLPALHP
jgi:BD-FAE